MESVQQKQIVVAVNAVAAGLLLVSCGEQPVAGYSTTSVNGGEAVQEMSYIINGFETAQRNSVARDIYSQNYAQVNYVYSGQAGSPFSLKLLVKNGTGLPTQQQLDLAMDVLKTFDATFADNGTVLAADLGPEIPPVIDINKRATSVSREVLMNLSSPSEKVDTLWHAIAESMIVDSTTPYRFAYAIKQAENGIDYDEYLITVLRGETVPASTVESPGRVLPMKPFNAEDYEKIQQIASMEMTSPKLRRTQNAQMPVELHEREYFADLVAKGFSVNGAVSLVQMAIMSGAII